MRVLAFTKYGRAAASTRQRVLQYLPRLAEADIQVEDGKKLVVKTLVDEFPAGKKWVERFAQVA